MSDSEYRGFVISDMGNSYIVISEKDKKQHVLPKKDGKVVTGNMVMPDGHTCNINETIFNDARLFSACREYSYDLKRHKVAYQRRKTTKNKIDAI